MREDYIKLSAIISHPDNKGIHVLPIMRLISFYCNKWNIEDEDASIIIKYTRNIFTERGLIHGKQG